MQLALSHWLHIAERREDVCDRLDGNTTAEEDVEYINSSNHSFTASLRPTHSLSFTHSLAPGRRDGVCDRLEGNTAAEEEVGTEKEQEREDGERSIHSFTPLLPASHSSFFLFHSFSVSQPAPGRRGDVCDRFESNPTSAEEAGTAEAEAEGGEEGGE